MLHPLQTLGPFFWHGKWRFSAEVHPTSKAYSVNCGSSFEQLFHKITPRLVRFMALHWNNCSTIQSHQRGHMKESTAQALWHESRWMQADMNFTPNATNVNTDVETRKKWTAVKKSMHQPGFQTLIASKIGDELTTYFTSLSGKDVGQARKEDLVAQGQLQQDAGPREKPERRQHLCTTTCMQKPRERARAYTVQHYTCAATPSSCAFSLSLGMQGEWGRSALLPTGGQSTRLARRQSSLAPCWRTRSRLSPVCPRVCPRVLAPLSETSWANRTDCTSERGNKTPPRFEALCRQL